MLYKNNLLSSSSSDLYHANGVAENSSYDNLYRLTSFARGTLSASGTNGTTLDTVSTASHTQSWSLDAQGSATSVTTDGTAQTRTVNSRDQLTGVGTSTLAFDNDGNTTTDERGYTFVYDPYGAVTVLSPSWSSTTDAYSWRYLFQGGRLDLTSALYNFRNRDYSPTLQRWMQSDPAGYVDGANTYQFVRSSPLDQTDAYGLFCSNYWWGVAKGAAKAAGILIGAVALTAVCPPAGIALLSIAAGAAAGDFANRYMDGQSAGAALLETAADMTGANGIAAGLMGPTSSATT